MTETFNEQGVKLTLEYEGDVPDKFVSGNFRTVAWHMLTILQLHGTDRCEDIIKLRESFLDEAIRIAASGGGDWDRWIPYGTD